MIPAINRENYYWTDHVKRKMRRYGLSESRVKRVLRHPKRLEVGVAENTVAGMQPAGSAKHPFEIWVMWTSKSASSKQSTINKNSPHPSPPLSRGGRNKKEFSFDGEKIIIISAWRYPGVSPLREPPPIPDDVWEILRKMKKTQKNP